MGTPTFTEADHPRGAAGRFTEKANSAPSGKLTVVVQVAPDAGKRARSCYYECGEPIAADDTGVVIVPGVEDPAHEECHAASGEAEAAYWRAQYDRRPRQGGRASEPGATTEVLFERADDTDD